MKRRVLLLLFTSIMTVLAQAARFDVLIQNGRIINGTGAPAAHGDIGIRDGKIVAIGKLSSQDADKYIDAHGLVVAPGFIDVHTHAEDIIEMPVGENFIRMGVTTLMLGNCGGSELDIDKFLRDVEATNICPNVATLIGHNTVRRKAMGGNFNRVPTEKEMAQMKNLVAKAMKDGAFGLSTGLIYLPGTFSKTDEIVELAKVASGFGGIYASHMRDEGLEIEDALNELFRIAREAKMRAHISHIKLSGRSAWGRATKITLPVSEPFAPNLPLKIKVPVSRQQVPIGNSTSPEKPTRSLVVCSQAAVRGAASGFESGAVSSNKKVTEPPDFASRIKFISLRPAKVNFTCQRPVSWISVGAAWVVTHESKQNRPSTHFNRSAVFISASCQF